MEALGYTEDVLESSEIEGKKLDSEQVRSSIARRLGRTSGHSSPRTAMWKASLK